MSTRRRVEFELVGSGASIEAVLNRVTAGINRVGQSGRSTNRELGLVDKQLMAIGTTMRYAFAGGIVFGITGALGRLTEFQNKLGQVAALAGNIASGQYNAPSGNLLGDIGSQALIESDKLGIAVGDVQDYMTRFYSSFADQARGRSGLNQLRQYVDEVGRLQASLGTEAGDPQQLAGGIAGLVNQIPGGTRNIGQTTNRISNLIWTLLAQTPNITGRDIGRDIGRVGATMTIANMTPEQAFAVWASAGKAGGSSSVIGRGVAQLLGTSLLHPNTPDQLQAFRQTGLPTDPTALRQMGGWQVLMRMMHAVAPGGIRVRNRAALGNEDIADEDAMGAAGVSGVNLTLLYHLLGRQESVRQFVNLLGNNGTTGLQRMFGEMSSAVRDNTSGQREAAAMNQRALQVAGNALANVPISVLRGPANAVARPAAYAARHVSDLLAGHRTTTTVVEGLMAGALGVAGVRRMWKGWRGLRKGGVGGAAGGMLGNAIMAEELPSLVAGAAADGSRANPYWVMISPASWYVGVPGGMFSSKTDNASEEQKLARSLWGKLKAPFAGAGGAALKGIGIGGAATIGAAASIPALWDEFVRSINGGGRTVPRGHPLLSHWVNSTAGMGASFVDKQPTAAQQAIISQFAGGMIGAPRAEALLRLLDRQQAAGVAGVNFSRADGSMDVTVRLVDAQGRTIATQRKGGVPVKWWPQQNAPTQGGKSKKGNH